MTTAATVEQNVRFLQHGVRFEIAGFSLPSMEIQLFCGSLLPDCKDFCDAVSAEYQEVSRVWLPSIAHITPISSVLR